MPRGTAFQWPFQYKNISSLKSQLATKPVRITMTQAFFKRQLANPNEFYSKFFAEFVGLSMLIVIDEFHQLCKSPKYANKILELQQLCEITKIIGVTATPTYVDNQKARENAGKILNTEPKTCEYTEEELRRLKSDLFPQSEPPKLWNVVSLEYPDEGAYGVYLGDLSDLMIGGMLYPDEDGTSQSTTTWMAQQNVIAAILADQVHELDGGKLFAELSMQGVKMKVVGADGEVATTGRYAMKTEAVLVAHAFGGGAEYHHAKLKEIHGNDGVRPFALFDTRRKDLAATKVEMDKFNDAFKGQSEGVCICIVDKETTQSGTNDFAKNVTGAIAIGPWEVHELTQFRGRLSRICKLRAGDIVPKELKLVHFSSDWAKEMNDLTSRKRVSVRNAPFSTEANELLAKVKDKMGEEDFLKRNVEEKAAKLASVSILSNLAERYLGYLSTEDDTEFKARFEGLLNDYKSFKEEEEEEDEGVEH